MSRKDFISDHLVDMRKQLSDSYETYHQEKAARNAAPPVPAAPAVAPEEKKESSPVAAVQEEHAARSPAPAAEKYLPAIRDEKLANERDWRELEGRIIHDLAAVECRKNMLQQELGELERFAAVLETSRGNIGKENISKVMQEYFAARGRWSAFDSGVSVSPESSPATDFRGMYWVAGAVFAGSLIVALVLIGLFS